MRRKAAWRRSFGSLAALAALLALPEPVISSAPAAPASQASASGNAADSWRQAIPLLKPKSDTHPQGLLTDPEWQTLNDLSLATLSMGEADQAKALLAKLQPAMRLIDDAASQRRCDFELDRRQGFELLLPHLSDMRSAARLLRLQGRLQLNDGDLAGYTETQTRIAGVALQPGQGEVLIGSLVGAAIGSLGVGSMQESIDGGQLTQQAAKDLLEGLAPLRADDPFHFGDAPAREFEAMEASLQRAAERRHGMREFLRQLGVDDEHVDRLASHTPRELLAALPSVKPIYDLYGQALRETDMTKAKALLTRANAQMEALKPPADVLKALAPSFDAVLKSRAAFRANLVALVKTLQAIADDPDGAARHTAPAILWARVAARVCALPDDTQAAVEALRAKGVTDAGESAEKALACLTGCDATIFEAMRVAAACERTDLDFSKVPGLEAWPPLPTLGGLRGAARLVAARVPLLDTDRAIAHLDLAFAAVAALASDPSQAAGCMAVAMARELVPAVSNVARRADLNDERRTKLEAAVNRVDRRDAFGFRASAAAERAIAERRLEPFKEDAERFEREMRRRTPEWLLAARVETGQVHAPVDHAGALEDTSDLFPVDRLVKANEARAAIDEILSRAWADRAQRAADAGERARPRSIASLPIEPIRDPAVDAQEAQAVLSALDAALRPAAAR